MIYFDKRHIKDRVDSAAMHEFLSFDLINENVMLAGGSLRGVFGDTTPIDDFDLFFTDGIAAAKVALELEDRGLKNVFTCPKGELKTYKKEGMKVQLITKNYYRDMKTLISSFDINACCIAFDGKSLLTTRNAIRDIKRKRVTLNIVTHPDATFKRIIKYNNKGYKVTNDAIKDFVDVVYNSGLEQAVISRQLYVD